MTEVYHLVYAHTNKKVRTFRRPWIPKIYACTTKIKSVFLGCPENVLTDQQLNASSSHSESNGADLYMRSAPYYTLTTYVVLMMFTGIAFASI